MQRMRQGMQHIARYLSSYSQDYQAVDDTDEDSELGVAGHATGYIQSFRVQFGPLASFVLFASVSSIFFMLAVFGEQFTMISTDYQPHSSSPITPPSALNSTNITMSGNKATHTNTSVVVLLPPSSTSQSNPAANANANKSSVFYWLLSLGTLVLLLAIVRSLLVLRRALSERAGSRSIFDMSIGRNTARTMSGIQLLNLLARDGERGLGMRNQLNHLMHRDLNANDYEMLTQLDAINQLHDSIGRTGSDRGASEQMINRLPLHNVTAAELQSKSNSNALTCAVCMEQLQEGDLMRTVLCMHSFHKQCIDPWLRMHATCPICKVSIHDDSDGEL